MIPTPEDLLQQGNQLRQAEQLDKAIALFQQAIELEGDNPWAYQYWGETLIQTGDFTEAQKCYIQGIKATPDFALHYHCLAQVLFWQDNISKSIAVSHKAIALEPHRADFHYQLGQALMKQGKLDSAISSYQQALQLSPELVVARQKLIEAMNQPLTPSSSTSKPYQPETKTHNQLSIFINQEYLNQIYSASLKLFISPPSRQALNFLTTKEQITIYEYQSHPATTGGIIVPLGAKVESQLVEMQLAPTFCLGFLVTSESERQYLNSLTEWWRSRCPPAELPPYLELQADPKSVAFKAHFWQLMFERSIVQTEAIAYRISTLQKQYLELRTLHENMQNAFTVVEDYLSQAKLPGLQLAFAQQPEPENIALKSFLSAEVTLKQLLPIASGSIAAVEIHLAQVDSQAEGRLIISLNTPDNEQFLANWTVPYSHLLAGWLKLDVPQIDLGYQKDVELVVTAITELGSAPSLSLGKTQIIPEACVRIQEVSQPRSLALRLWKGLPGTHRAISPYATFTSTSTANDPISQQPQQGYLGQCTMSGVVEITPNLPQDDFPHIEVIEEGKKILTHPRKTGASTIAMLPFCISPKLKRIVATVATEHPAAGIIEYAMAVIDIGIEPLTCLDRDNLPSTSANSGWMAIAPNHPHHIDLLIPPAPQHRHLVIGAKLPAAGSYTYAWARWLNFWLEAN